mmetsp:Transcript_31944/g.100383  ORF Transcript_31944/g.100383 Transcript_31944/m.100383 type:complete len:282 (-) Transcript_31944:165-1010(-)
MSSITNELIAGTAAGFASTILGAPLDAVKVRMQHLQQPGLTTWACALAMLRESGVPAFFRGVGVPLLNSVLMNTVMFVVFEEVRSALPDTTGGALAAGAVSGLAQSLLSTPMDLLKIQVQLRGRHPLSILRRLAARSGAVGVASTLSVGGSMNMLREGVFTAVYLGLYSRLRQRLELAHGEQALHSGHVLALSAPVGALAWLSCYGFDTVKSVQQSQPLDRSAANKAPPLSTVAGATRHVWERGGVAGFYRGALASTSRAVLVTASRLVAYERTKALLSEA